MRIPLRMEDESLAVRLGAQRVHPSLLKYIYKNVDFIFVNQNKGGLLVWKVDPDAYRAI